MTPAQISNILHSPSSEADSSELSFSRDSRRVSQKQAERHTNSLQQAQNIALIVLLWLSLLSKSSGQLHEQSPARIHIKDGPSIAKCIPGELNLNNNRSLNTVSKPTIERLYRSSPNSLIYIEDSFMETTRKLPPIDQILFGSVCNAWQNSYWYKSETQFSKAFWVLDREQKSLVAKFIFREHSEFTYNFGMTAALRSPIIPVAPKNSNDSESCTLGFSLYNTLNCRVEVLYEGISENPTKTSSETLLQVGGSSNSKRDENWKSYRLSVPMNVSESASYRIQFHAILSTVSGLQLSTKQSKYLLGVAITNLSMSSSCFLKSQDNQLVLLDENPATRGPNFRFSWTSPNESILMLVGTTLVFVVFVILIAVIYLLCSHFREHRSDLRKKPLWWRICCCCCCCFEPKRIHVYVAKQNGQVDGNAKLRVADEDELAYLRPLRNVFENLELNENPNYLTNGAWTTKSIIGPLEAYQIDRKLLTLTKPLGKGAFGEVYQGYLVCYCDNQFNSDFSESDSDSHSVKVAVKTLTNERMSLTEFTREAINMSQVNHRNIVKLIGVCFEERPMYIVMELLVGGNLKNFLHKNRDRSHYQSQVLPANDVHSGANSLYVTQSNPRIGQENRVKLCMGDLLVYALDIARACDYLQKRRFVHRDVAARNCLLTCDIKTVATSSRPGSPIDPQLKSPARSTFGSPPPSALEVNANHKVDLDQVFLNGYQNSSIVAKLADFGMTRDIYSNDYYRMRCQKEMPVRWMPPECLDGLATTKSDVWSFGIFLWELFSMGQMPYPDLPGNHDVIEFLKSRRYVSRTKARDSDSRVAAPSPGNELAPELLLVTLNDEEDNQLEEDSSGAPESADLPPPLEPPHEDTPISVYSIMCSCWATNPEERPQFEEIANRLYWCLQMPRILETSLPCFYEQPVGGSLRARSESRSGSTQTSQLNWW